MGTISITFDSDHMSEKSMINFLKGANIEGAATFFCTQRYDCLSAGQDLHEVGIHPVLDYTTEWGSFSSDLKNECGEEIVSGARAHSLAYKQQYGVWLAKNGFRYVSQNTLYYQSRIKPFYHPWGLWELPIYYQDNADMDMAKSVPSFKALDIKYLEKAIEEDGIYVFAFHPVHIMLDTDCYDTYTKWRQAGNPDLEEFTKSQNFGIGAYFGILNKMLQKAGKKSIALRDLIPEKLIIDDWIGLK